MRAIVVTSIIIMVNIVNFNIHYCYGEEKTILSELVLIIIMVFPRRLILVQNILIYLLYRNTEHKLTYVSQPHTYA